MRPAAVLFDLDNTLVDRDGAFARWISTLGLTPRQRTELLRRDDHGFADREDVCAWLSMTKPELGRPQHVWQHMRSGVAERVRQYDEVIDAVDKVRSLARVAVVTNGGSENQRTKLDRAGLTDMFDCVLISAELGVRKPQRAMFEAALARLRVDASAALFVGDNPIEDIAGASAAGLATCYVSRGGATIEADLVVNSVVDLPEALA